MILYKLIFGMFFFATAVFVIVAQWKRTKKNLAVIVLTQVDLALLLIAGIVLVTQAIKF